MSSAAAASSKLHGLGNDSSSNPSDDKDSNLAERRKIRLAFELFDRDRKRTVPKEEVGTIMRYLGAYPSEEELLNDILPNLSDDEETAVVKLEQFETFMLRVMMDRMYEPDSEEMILQAFKALDPENRGYIDEHTMHELLTENEYAFRDKEWEDFCTGRSTLHLWRSLAGQTASAASVFSSFLLLSAFRSLLTARIAKDPDTNYIHYEDYVSMLSS
jgi:calmodulin